MSNRALAIFLLLVGMAAGRPNLRARRHLSQRQPHLRFVKEYVRELIADESLKINGEKEFGEAKTDNERIADRKVGRRLGVCCVYYPRGPWDTAETIMYPNIVTKGPGQATLRELMDSDLARFSKDNPGMSHVDGDMPFNGRTAKLRYFHGVNQGSSEAVAYIDEEKIIALVVLSSKTEKGLTEALPLLLGVLETYTYGVKAMNAN